MLLKIVKILIRQKLPVKTENDQLLGQMKRIPTTPTEVDENVQRYQKSVYLYRPNISEIGFMIDMAHICIHRSVVQYINHGKY